MELIDVRELNPGVIQSTEQYTFIFSRFMPGEPKYCSVSSSEQLLLTSTILFLLGLLRLSIACGLLNSKLNDRSVFRYCQSNVWQLLTASDYCHSLFFRCLIWTVLYDLITARSAEVGSLKEPPNVWLTVKKNPFGGRGLNFRDRILLKVAVMHSDVQLNLKICLLTL